MKDKNALTISSSVCAVKLAIKEAAYLNINQHTSLSLNFGAMLLKYRAIQ
jgi:hypothetical protein